MCEFFKTGKPPVSPRRDHRNFRIYGSRGRKQENRAVSPSKLADIIERAKEKSAETRAVQRWRTNDDRDQSSKFSHRGNRRDGGTRRASKRSRAAAANEKVVLAIMGANNRGSQLATTLAKIAGGPNRVHMRLRRERDQERN